MPRVDYLHEPEPRQKSPLPAPLALPMEQLGRVALPVEQLGRVALPVEQLGRVE